jgi:hypothetical protein
MSFSMSGCVRSVRITRPNRADAFSPMSSIANTRSAVGLLVDEEGIGL